MHRGSRFRTEFLQGRGEAIRADDSQDLFLIYDAGNGHEGVMGIVAGKLKEEFYRPVIIVTDTEEEGLSKERGEA